jgi:hypothetical protein
MKRRLPIRRPRRFPIRWPMVYGNEEFLAEGTVLDLRRHSWRVAGTMPVEAGMRLRLQVWPQSKPDGLRIEQATVLWVKDGEFALEVNRIGPPDREEATQFIDHLLGPRFLPRAASRPASFPGGISRGRGVPSRRRTGWEKPAWPCRKDSNREHGG